MLCIGICLSASNEECYILLQVAYTGEDVETIPSHLWEKYGQTARRLDLSYNRLR